MNKHILIFIAFISFSSPLLAQNNAITNAILYYQEGNLKQAKEEIDLAVANDKTKKSSKAWYYRGLIYEGIAHSQNTEFNKLSDHAASEAYLSWNNAIRYDTAGKKEFARKSREDRVRVWPDFVNSGTELLKERKYDEAIKQYDIAQELNPKDTVAYVYGIIAATYKPDYAKLDQYTDSLFKYSPVKPALFLNKATVARELRKDTTEAIAWCDKGLVKFPGNEQLSREKGWMLAATGKKKEALVVLAPLVPLNSEDETFLNFVAGLYENTGQATEAIKVYEQLVSVNPADATAWYNLTAIQYNKANELWKEGKKEEAKALYVKCMASGEKALATSVSEGDKTTLKYIITDANSKLK